MARRAAMPVALRRDAGGSRETRRSGDEARAAEYAGPLDQRKVPGRGITGGHDYFARASCEQCGTLDLVTPSRARATQ